MAPSVKHVQTTTTTTLCAQSALLKIRAQDMVCAIQQQVHQFELFALTSVL